MYQQKNSAGYFSTILCFNSRHEWPPELSWLSLSRKYQVGIAWNW